VVEAFGDLTDIYWVQVTAGRTPKQAFTNAQALLQKHGTALQGSGDKLTRYGGNKISSQNYDVREYDRANAQKEKDPEYWQLFSSAHVIDRRNGATNVRRNGATNRCVKRHLEGVKQ
jgi:hypothetical protein